MVVMEVLGWGVGVVVVVVVVWWLWIFVKWLLWRRLLGFVEKAALEREHLDRHRRRRRRRFRKWRHSLKHYS